MSADAHAQGALRYAQGALRYDYAAVGHVTVDVLDDGTRRAGGSALYAALQAARLGLRALIVTSGVVDELETVLAPYSDEVDVDIRPAAQTTTLTASGRDDKRRQRLLTWAGPIAGALPRDAAILHLAPVARELPAGDVPNAPFVGLTPQGLIRRWAALGDEIELAEATDAASLALAAGCHGMVVSDRERPACAGLIDAAASAGALTAVTAGSRPVTVLAAGAAPVQVPVPGLPDPVDDLGAGDVFAAALFVALSEGREPREAVGIASAAAAVRMGGQGPDAIGDAPAIRARATSGAG